MKITAREEYGLRILLRVALSENAEGTTIGQISEDESLSSYNVAKLCRILRIADFIKSSRGTAGGYTLSRPAEEIMLAGVLETLGGRLYSQEFCESHAGLTGSCSNSGGCSVKKLWVKIQDSVDEVLNNMSLADLIQLNQKAADTPRKPEYVTLS